MTHIFVFYLNILEIIKKKPPLTTKARLFFTKTQQRAGGFPGENPRQSQRPRGWAPNLPALHPVLQTRRRYRR